MAPPPHHRTKGEPDRLAQGQQRDAERPGAPGDPRHVRTDGGTGVRRPSGPDPEIDDSGSDMIHVEDSHDLGGGCSAGGGFGGGGALGGLMIALAQLTRRKRR